MREKTTITNKREIKEMYFYRPVQVGYNTDINNEDIFGGIAYCSEILNGDDGSVIPLDEIELLILYSWMPIGEELIGS